MARNSRRRTNRVIAWVASVALVAGLVPIPALAFAEEAGEPGADAPAAVEANEADSQPEAAPAPDAGSAVSQAAEPAAPDAGAETEPAEGEQAVAGDGTGGEAAAQTTEGAESDDAQAVDPTEAYDENNDNAEEAGEGEDDEKAEGKDEDVEDKKAESPAFKQSKTVDGVTVTVEADAGAFPEGAELFVASAPASATEAAVAQERDENENVAVSYTFDIKVLDKEGEEVQPKDGKAVRVSFAAAEVVDPNLDVSIYHVSGGAAEELPVSESGSTATAQSTGFSYYTVEFTYGDLQYVLQGGSEVALSEILVAVGLVGDPTDVEVSDPALFSASDDSGAWVVSSHKAFSSTEWMRVTIAGQPYEIKVTDAQPDTRGTVRTWTSGATTCTLTDDGTFTVSGMGEMYNYNNVSDVPWHDSRGDITKVVIENGVTTVGQFSFHACGNLKEVAIGKDVTSIGGHAFDRCYSLASVEISGGVTSIGDYAFINCALQSAPIPDGVETIGDNAFATCTSLTTVSIPSSVTTIGDMAFVGCTSLTTVSIPSSVTTIGDSAFFFCTSLENVYFGGTKGQYSSLIGDSKLPDVDSGKVHCMDYTVSASASPLEGGAVRGWGMYSDNDLYTLTAVPAKGYHFVNWIKDGKPVGTSTTYSFTATGNCEFTANFELDKHEIEASANIEGGGTVSGGKTYEYGQTAILKAAPANGYVFDQWTEDGTTVTDGQGKKIGAEYSFTVTGDRTLVANFRQILIVDAEHEKLQTWEYTGNPITFPIKVYLDGVDEALEPDTDYEFEFKDNVDVGEGKIDVKLTGSWEGTATAKFDITPTSISGAKVEVKDQVYSGKGLTPDPTVTYNGKTLQKGKDYTLSYESNVGVGTATVIVTGKGNFDSRTSARGTFEIGQRRMTITAKDQHLAYNGKKQGPGDAAYDDPAKIAEMVTVSGLQDGDELTSIVIDGQGDVADTYPLVPSGASIGEGGASTGNYDITYVNGTLTIEPSEATITVDSASKMEGAGDPVFTGKVEGLVKEGDLGVVRYVRTGSDEKPGTYEGVLTATYTANPNYDVTVVPGDFTIEAAPAKPTYRVVFGAGGTWTEGSDAPMTFRIERTVDPETAFEHFAGILMDGKAVPEEDASGVVNWTAKSGSVIIELQPSYLATLPAGKHTLTALFDDGDPVSAEFTVSESKAKPSGATGKTSSSGTPRSTARTGDAASPAVPMALGLAAASGLAIAAYALRRRRRGM